MRTNTKLLDIQGRFSEIFEKRATFSENPEIHYRGHQTSRKSVGTLVVTFLTCSRPPGRLRRPRAPIPPPLELLSLLPNNQQPTTLDGQNRQKSMKINDFQDFFENLDFLIKNKSRQIDSGVILGHTYLPGNDSQTLRRRSTRASSDCG